MHFVDKDVGTQSLPNTADEHAKITPMERNLTVYQNYLCIGPWTQQPQF